MIIFLYGSDSFRSREKLDDLKDNFNKKVDQSGNSLSYIDGSSARLESINELIGSSSLFSKKRMIIIEHVLANKDKKFQKEAIELFDRFLAAGQKASNKKNDDQDNVILFRDETDEKENSRNPLFKFLLKADFKQSFIPLSNQQVVKWIAQRVDQEGCQIRSQAAVLLASMFSSDLWQLSHEIKKLCHYKLGSQGQLVEGAQKAIIESKDVELMVRGNFEENIFALTDAISMKNKARALYLFEEELDVGTAETYLMHMIMRQFKVLLQIRQALDSGLTTRNMASALKLHPFVVKKAVSQVRNFSLLTLKNIFKSLIETDKKIKTGQGDLKTEINLVINSL